MTKLVTKINSISFAAIVSFKALGSTTLTFACLEPARADSGADSIETSFPDGSNASAFGSSSAAAVAPLRSPLSGSVRVIDQMAKPTRLKRVESSPAVADQSSSASSSFMPAPAPASPASGQSGGIADSGLQALFPSKDSFNPPPVLNGSANSGFAGPEPVKAKKKHVYIWNMSLAGGYYDVTNTFQGVVPGNKLYLYGGFMADGHTPVPSGPVPMNAGGHIRWTPTMGEAPED